MIIGFSPHHGDSGVGVVGYFLSSQMPTPGGPPVRRNPKPELLVGDPRLFTATVEVLPFQNRYVSGTLSFSSADVDVAAFNAGDPTSRRMVEEILDVLQESLLPGVPQPARPHLIIGTHTHTNRLELNFAVPQAITRPDGMLRAFNPAPPGKASERLWDATRDLINLRFGSVRFGSVRFGSVRARRSDGSKSNSAVLAAFLAPQKMGCRAAGGQGA